MKKILESIKTAFGVNLAKIICAICDTIQAFLSYKTTSNKQKEERRQLKIDKEFEDKIDNVTKNGSLTDLLDLKRSVK